MSDRQAAAKTYAPGIGEAVANRTINRDIVQPYQRKQTIRTKLAWDSGKDLDKAVEAWCNHMGYIHESYTVEETSKGFAHVAIIANARKRKETWAEVAARVTEGNTALAKTSKKEKEKLLDHLSRATVLTSGRHLQHGDATQPDRPMEVFTNCSTSVASFVTFYLLLNGSGVGRAYDDDLMVVDWCNMPIVVPVIDHTHPDVMSGEINALTKASAEHMYKFAKRRYFEVPDTREGWAKAVEVLESMAFEKRSDEILILDFSGVRERGAPIKGMQNRPASGPGPLMEALTKITAIRGSGMRPWRAAMFVDHYLAECVLVGGARRAARMSTKSWRDKGVLEFIGIKRGGHLWSSNNSVTVDHQFWENVDSGASGALSAHANRVLDAALNAAYHDGTGEPGFINQDKLVDKGDTSIYLDGKILDESRYQQEPATDRMFQQIVQNASEMPYKMLVNPCSEIALLLWGGYCVLADVVPYHAKDLDDAEQAFRVATRFLIRVNRMNSLYWREVNRTNRIGVSMTGVHEFALSHFGYTWKDLIDEEKSQPFWNAIARFKRAVDDEADKYAAKLGMVSPHTTTTVKPAGTTSKLFDLTEGVHLPAMREYLRSVQFRNDDPLLDKYREMGYPTKKLRTYGGTTIVSFPTRPQICSLAEDSSFITTASEATPAEQYAWVRLLEKYWIIGVDSENRLRDSGKGNQISYTLKIDTSKVSFKEYKETFIENQRTIRCCSVMPSNPDDEQVYEYLPEQPVTKEEYEMILEEINRKLVDVEEVVEEDVDLDTLICASGACPI